MTLHGIPASPGIAIGPIVVYVPQSREHIPQISLLAPPQEWERLEVALHEARGQIADLREAVALRASAEEAAIFDAHLLVLEDDELLQEIRRHIVDRQQNAETATWAAMDIYRQQLLAIDDEYLRARAADLEDIALRIIACLQGTRHNPLAQLLTPSIIIAHDLLPSDTAALDPAKTLALATELGGPTAHTAILARQLNIPAIVGATGLLAAITAQPVPPLVAIDGGSGTIEIAPDAATAAHYVALRDAFQLQTTRLKDMALLPNVTPDGHSVELAANIGNPADAAKSIEFGATGVGLFRTEFLFLDRAAPPSEDEQVQAYVTAASYFTTGTVIIRTLDIGGDKTIPYLPQAHEDNPFLGMRGLRLCLAPHFLPLFQTQVRAILRAAIQGARLQVMFPMVNTLAEMQAARAIFTAVATTLDTEGLPATDALHHLLIGAMIETPAAAITTDQLAAQCDFFSIGTNDLTQYVLAVDRMNVAVAPIYTPYSPAVLRAIYAAVSGAHSRGRKIGMCGELAGDPKATALLLGMGLDELSMSPQSLPHVKQILRHCTLTRARQIMDLVFRLTTPQEVDEVLTTSLRELEDTMEM